MTGRPRIADRLRRMPAGRAWKALGRLLTRHTMGAPAPFYFHRYTGGGIGQRGRWIADSYRYPPILAARFPDGSAIALREPADAYDA